MQNWDIGSVWFPSPLWSCLYCFGKRSEWSRWTCHSGPTLLSYFLSSLPTLPDSRIHRWQMWVSREGPAVIIWLTKQCSRSLGNVCSRNVLLPTAQLLPVFPGWPPKLLRHLDSLMSPSKKAKHGRDEVSSLLPTQGSFTGGRPLFFPWEDSNILLSNPHWKRSSWKGNLSTNSRIRNQKNTIYTRETCDVRSPQGGKNWFSGWGVKKLLDITMVCGPLKGHSA